MPIGETYVPLSLFGPKEVIRERRGLVILINIKPKQLKIDKPAYGLFSTILNLLFQNAQITQQLPLKITQ